MCMIQVRLANPDDKSGIDKITKEFDTHGYSHPPKYFDDCYATNSILVALENNVIVGYLVYHVIWGNTPFIELIQIPSMSQKKGIGSKLVLALEKKLKTEGFNTLLSSSEVINNMGNAFHQKVGFEHVGVIDMFYGKENFYRKQI